MRSISHNIMPLVIDSPVGGDTHTHKYTHTHTDTDICTETILRNQVYTGLQKAQAWFSKSATIRNGIRLWPRFIYNINLTGTG